MHMMVHNGDTDGFGERRNVLFVEPIVYQLQLPTTDEPEMILLGHYQVIELLRLPRKASIAFVKIHWRELAYPCGC
jgi:hypothetical protein